MDKYIHPLCLVERFLDRRGLISIDLVSSFIKLQGKEELVCLLFTRQNG